MYYYYEKTESPNEFQTILALLSEKFPIASTSNAIEKYADRASISTDEEFTTATIYIKERAARVTVANELVPLALTEENVEFSTFHDDFEVTWRTPEKGGTRELVKTLWVRSGN